MANRTFNFEAWKDRDRRFKVRFPYDITGYTFAAQLRASSNETGSPAATFQVSVDTVNDEVTLTLEDASTAALTSGRYVWDLKETDSGGGTRHVVGGVCTLKESVTL